MNELSFLMDFDHGERAERLPYSRGIVTFSHFQLQLAPSSVILRNGMVLREGQA
jgi:hypothetical protein